MCVVCIYYSHQFREMVQVRRIRKKTHSVGPTGTATLKCWTHCSHSWECTHSSHDHETNAQAVPWRFGILLESLLEMFLTKWININYLFSVWNFSAKEISGNCECCCWLFHTAVTVMFQRWVKYGACLSGIFRAVRDVGGSRVWVFSTRLYNYRSQ